MTISSRVLTLAAVGLFAAVASPAMAGAASAALSGWWTWAPVAVAPDVADDQLLVQGGPDPSQPVAYAGITFALAPDEVPQKLTLSVASNSVTTPGATVALCHLGTPAYPAKGDPASGGPPFDCTTKVEGSPSSSGATYEFAVTALAKGGALDIAVVPTQPTDRVVFTKPAVGALQSESGGTTSPSPSAAPETGSVVSGAASTDVSGLAESTGQATSAASVGLDAGGAPTEPVTPAAATAAPASTDSSTPAVRLARPTASQQSSGSSRSLTPLAFGGMAAAAAALWALAGQRSPEAAGETGTTSTSDVGEHR